MTTRCRWNGASERGHRSFARGSGFIGGIISLVWAFIHGSAFAATLTINLQISNIVHHFTPPSPTFGLPGRVNDEIAYDNAGLTNVTLSDYSTFELRFFAENGKQILVNATNFISSLNVVYMAADDTFTHSVLADLRFENFAGAAPVRIDNLFSVGNDGDGLWFLADESYTTGVAFTAMKYSFAPGYIPPNTPKVFQSTSYAPIPVSFAYATSQTNDPGPFVALGDAPLTAALSGTPDDLSISWLTKLNKQYQLQSAIELRTNAWQDLGGQITGDGSNKSVRVTMDQPTKFFRIKLLSPD